MITHPSNTTTQTSSASSGAAHGHRRRGNRLIGALRLVRLSNSLPAAGLVLLGARLSVGWPWPASVWAAAAAMWMVTAFGYVSNDYHDVAEDRINKPDRPLPAGYVPLWLARALISLLATGAVGVAAWIGWAELVVALAVLALLTLYNRRLKATPAVGNLLIGGLAGCALIAGGVAAQGFAWRAIGTLAAPAGLLAAFITARELVKTLEDAPGDRATGKRTAAVQLGSRGVLTLVAGLALVGGGLSVIPVLRGEVSPAFLWLACVGVQGPLFFAVIYLWRSATPVRIRRCLRLLKGSYWAGLAALLLA